MYEYWASKWNQILGILLDSKLTCKVYIDSKLLHGLNSVGSRCDSCHNMGRSNVFFGLSLSFAVSNSEIINIISKFKNESSCGIDDTPDFLILKSDKIIVGPLVNLINSYLWEVPR